MQSILINQLDKGQINPSMVFDVNTQTSKRNNFAEFMNKQKNETEKGRKMYYIH